MSLRNKSLHSGRRYELFILQRLRSFRVHDRNLGVRENTAGAGHGNDIGVIYQEQNVGIEVKNKGGFEGGGSKLEHNKDRWETESFLKPVIDIVNPYDGRIPSCLAGTDRSLATWNKEKKEFPDMYVDMPNTSISDYYRAKGSQYIQIEGKGLYHTGEDPMNLGVPLFSVSTRLRIRLTKHKKKGVPTDMTAALVFKRRDLMKSTFCFQTNLPSSIQMMEVAE
jgi:hypothetical protein